MNTDDTRTGLVPPSRKPRPLSAGEARAVAGVALLIAFLGILGFVNSFAAVARAAHPAFGALAPTVPLGTDVAIAAFSAADIVLARLDMQPKWVKFIPWLLTAATIYLNIADQATWFGRAGHAVFPLLWVLAVSLATHVVRVRAQLDNGTRMDRIRRSRWLLAPASTVALWRRMVLWEITSYPDALDRERHRLLALTELQDAYGGYAWRWRAPRRVRALYRLGELAPAAPAQDQPRTDGGEVPAIDPVRADPRTDAARTGGDNHAGAARTEPARTDPPDAASRTGRGARRGQDSTGGEPAVASAWSALPRSEVVERIAQQIRGAVDDGTVWAPDYDTLMTSTERGRSWCEKVVRDARNRVLTGDAGPDGEPPRLHAVTAAAGTPDASGGPDAGSGGPGQDPLKDAS